MVSQYPSCSPHAFYCPTWKCTNLAMLGSAMNIWCSRQQMRHCTSLRLLSRPPSIAAPSAFLQPLSSRAPSFDLTEAGPLRLVCGPSLLAPSCCSSEVGRHTSSRIWTAALSWRQTDVYARDQSAPRAGHIHTFFFKRQEREWRGDATVLRVRVGSLKSTWAARSAFFSSSLVTSGASSCPHTPWFEMVWLWRSKSAVSFRWHCK